MEGIMVNRRVGCCTVLILAALSLIAAYPLASDVAALHEFNDVTNHLAASIGPALTYHPSAPPMVQEPCSQGMCVQCDPSKYLKVTHGLAGNGGGANVNMYSILMDVSVPTLGVGSLVQLSATNVDDRDVVFDAAGAVGIIDDTATLRMSAGGVVTAGQMVRIVITVDLSAPRVKVFADGTNVLDVSSNIYLDGGLSSATDVLYGADDNAEQTTFQLMNAVLYGRTLSNAEVLALGDSLNWTWGATQCPRCQNGGTLSDLDPCTCTCLVPYEGTLCENSAHIGDSVVMNGLVSFFDIPADNAFDPNDLTVEMWVYPTATLARMNLIDRDPWTLYLTNLQPTFSVTGSTVAAEVAPSAISPNKWSHVAVVYSSLKILIYINGVLDHSATYGNAKTSPGAVAGRIGRCSHLCGGINYGFYGSLDEVRVWNVARDVSDISHGMPVSFAAEEIGLVANYAFNVTDATSNVGHDSSTNNFHLAVTSVTTSIDSENWRCSDAVGLAGGPHLHCNGLSVPLDSFVRIASDPAIDLTSSEFTVEMWVNRAASGSVMTMFSFGSKTASQGLYMQYTAANKVQLSFFGDTPLVTPRAYNDEGEWHLWGCSYRISGGTMRVIYRDGEVVAAENYGTGHLAGTGDLIIGDYFGDLTNSFEGVIGEVRVWNAVRTVAEISEWSNKQLDCSEVNLVGYWKVHEHSAYVVNDYTSNENHGNLHVSTTNPSHRRVTNAKHFHVLGGGRVFDGYTYGVDLAYQSFEFADHFYANNTHVSANWSGFESQHTPVTYEWMVGTKRCSADVVPLTSLGPVTRTYEELTTAMPNGQRIFVTIKATDSSGDVDWSTSNGVLLDSTPPVTGTVAADQTYWPHLNYVDMTWSGFSDSESGIAYYEMCVGNTTTVWTNQLYKFTSNMALSKSTVNLVDLTEGVEYFIRLVAYNGAGLNTTVISNAFWYHNSSLPLAMPVTVAVNALGAFHASWTPFVDSYALAYDWALGSASGLQDFAGWSTTGLTGTTITAPKPGSVVQGTICFFQVRATDMLGNQTISETSIVFDLTAPIQGPGNTVLSIDTNLTMTVAFPLFVDLESPPVTYVWELKDIGGTILLPSTSAGVDSVNGIITYQLAGLGLSEGQVEVEITATNNVLNPATVMSNTAHLDWTHPVAAHLVNNDVVVSRWMMRYDLKNGDHSHVRVEDPSMLFEVPEFTLEAWLYPEDLLERRFIISRKPFHLFMEPLGHVRLALDGIAGSATWNSLGKMVAQQWTHVAVSYKFVSGQVFVYFIFNGHEDPLGMPGSMTTLSPAYTVTTFPHPLYIGYCGICANNPTAITGLTIDHVDSSWYGYISKVRMWSNVRPYGTIDLFQMDKAVGDPDLILNLELDTPSSSPADTSVNAFVTVANVTAFQTAPAYDNVEWTNSTWIKASWTGWTDTVGIVSYAWGVGSTPGALDIKPFDSSYISGTSGMYQCNTLNDGDEYWVTVGAYDQGQGFVNATANKVTYDGSPAQIVAIADMDHTGVLLLADKNYTNSMTTFGFSWGAMDSHSGIKYYKVALGTSPGATDLYPYTDNDPNLVNLVGAPPHGAIITIPAVVPGVTVYATLQVINGVDTPSFGTTDGIMVDVDSPEIEWVKNGDLALTEVDGNYFVNATRFRFSYKAYDVFSGLASVTYEIGTTAFGNDIQPSTAITVQALGHSSSDINSVTFTAFTFLENLDYYVTVTAVNGVGLSTTMCSKGARYDMWAPVVGLLMDNVFEETGHVAQYQTLKDGIEARFSGWSDAVSGIDYCEWAIGTSACADDLQAWTQSGIEGNDCRNHALSLNDGTVYFLSGRCTDYAGLTSTAYCGTGVRVDNAAPLVDPAVISNMNHLATEVNFIDEQIQVEYLTSYQGVNWASFSPGTLTYEWAIGTSAGASDVMAWTATGIDQVARTASKTNVPVTPGTLGVVNYHIAIRGFDKVTRTTNQMSFPAVNNAYAVQTTTIGAWWSGFTDLVSGIHHFEWACGTTPGGIEVFAFTKEGIVWTPTIIKATKTAGMPLVAGTSYYITVKAYDVTDQVSIKTSKAVKLIF